MLSPDRLHLLDDGDGPVQEVDVLPSKRAEFPGTKPAVGRERDQGSVPRVDHGSERRHLVMRQEPHGLHFDSRRLDGAQRVPAHELVVHRSGQHPVEHPVERPVGLRH